jgi:hypothetical protein
MIQYLKSQLADLKSERSYLIRKKTRWPVKDAVSLMTSRINALYRMLNINTEETQRVNPEDTGRLTRMFRQFD